MHYLVRHFGCEHLILRLGRLYTRCVSFKNFFSCNFKQREIVAKKLKFVFLLLQLGIFSNDFLYRSSSRNYDSSIKEASIRRRRVRWSKMSKIFNDVVFPFPLDTLHDFVNTRSLWGHQRILKE